MPANVRLLVRVAAMLLLVAAMILAGQPVPASAEPSGDGITYVVKPGDRLVDIAARYGVSASAIVAANNLTNADQIYPGQHLSIPGAAGSPTSSPTNTPESNTGTQPLPSTPGAIPRPGVGGQQVTTTYDVQLGDTLASIARRFNVSAAALQQANNITNPDLIRIGQQLVIPSRVGSATGDSQPGPAAQPSPQPTPVPTSAAPATPVSSATPASKTTATPPAGVTAVQIYVVQAGETLSQIAKRYGVSVDAIVAANGLGSADVIGVGVRLIIPVPGGAASTDGSTGPRQATKFVASISQQRCWLYSGETVIARWICSTGRSGSSTRPGTYKIQSKMPKAYGSTWNIWMPFWLGIYWAGGSENGIHGLPWNATTGVQIWSGNVGHPITFGCVMLDNVNAKLLYDMAWIGMPVVIRP